MKGKRLKIKKLKFAKVDPGLRFDSGASNSQLIFILGGARSGKSSCALKLAESMPGKRLYLAAAEALDDEMTDRIKKHKKERGNNWTTIEEPIKIADIIKKNKKYDVILLDCLTLWISNLMHEKSGVKKPEKQRQSIYKTIEHLAAVCKDSKANIIVVSNEIGLGIVPDNPLAREFRDLAGNANRKIAMAADEAYLVTAGIPIKIK